MNYIWNESRMPEMGLSGLMSGEWKRVQGGIVRHRQPKGPETAMAQAYTPPRHSSTLQNAHLQL